MAEPRASREGDARLRDEENGKRWIQKHLANAPRLSDQQLRDVGEILGIKLVRRNARPE